MVEMISSLCMVKADKKDVKCRYAYTIWEYNDEDPPFLPSIMLIIKNSSLSRMRNKIFVIWLDSVNGNTEQHA